MEIPSEDPRDLYKDAIQYTINGLGRIKQLIETPQQPGSSNALEQEKMIVRYSSIIFEQIDGYMRGNEALRETDDVIRKTNSAIFDLRQTISRTPNPTAADIDDWIDDLKKTPVMAE
jgi:hypothetical protein